MTVAAGLLAAAIVVSSLDDGGYSGNAQGILLVLAAGALVAAMQLSPRNFVAAVHAPVAVVLLLLGAVTILSATWTIGEPTTAIRWGMVIVAYGSLTVSAWVLTTSCGVRPLATAILLVAMLEALLGLTCAALRLRPLASLVADSWRPGGTYEYAAALGLVQVCGLSAALLAGASPRRATAYSGGFALALTGATLGCIDSRSDLALAAGTLLALAALPDRRLLPRHVVLAGSGLIAAAAVASALLLGRHVSPGGSGGGGLRLAGIALACIGLAAAWPMVRAIASKISYRQLAIGVSLAIGVTAVVWLTAGYTSTVTSTGGGFGHGRISYWHAAVDAWTQRPLLGSGAGTFYQASVAYQQNHDMTSFAHNLPLELAAELGIPGFLLGLALYATSALELKRAVRFPDAWLLAPTAACFLLANLVDWPWHLAGLGAMWAAAIGALASTRSRAPRKPHGSALTVSLAWPYRGRSLRRRRR